MATGSEDAPSKASPTLEMGRRAGALWGRIAWTLPIGAFLFVTGFFFIPAAIDLRGGVDGDALRILGLWFFFALVLLVGAYDTARVARQSGPALRIDEAGVYDRRIQRAALPWRGIASAEVCLLEGRPVFLGIAGPGVSAAKRRLPFFGYFGLVTVLGRMAQRAGMPGFAVDLESLDGDPETVIAAMEARLGPLPRRDATPKIAPSSP